MTTPTPDTGRPLADADLERLEQLLAERVLPNEGMSLEILDGFLSALVVGPEPVPAAEYLPEVWGEGTPAWASPAEPDEAAALVEALRRHILWRVQREPQELGEAAWPFVMLPPESDDGEVDPELADFPAGAGWAIGFLHGVGLREAAWSQRIEENEQVGEDIDGLLALAWLGDAEDDEIGADDDEAEAAAEPEAMDEPEDDAGPLDLEQRLDLIAELPQVLHELHCLHIDEQRPAPARRPAVPGRNDACPCGSGRKYKKCCGA